MKNDAILNLAKALAERHGRLRSAEWVMRFFGMMTFGIESVSCAGRIARYVNRGDTYTRTVYATYNEVGGEYTVGDWGTWYEETESEHCAENDEVRCGYCGELTALCDKAQAQPQGARHAWRETICQHCGRNVASGELAATLAE